LVLGENLFSSIDGRNLLRYGGMRPDRDIIQIDPAISYGLTEYLRFLDVLKEHGWSRRRLIPHGGHQVKTVCAQSNFSTILTWLVFSWLSILLLGYRLVGVNRTQVYFNHTVALLTIFQLWMGLLLFLRMRLELGWS
jgi:hypothetical protein